VKTRVHFRLRKLAFFTFCSLLLAALLYPQEVTHKITFTFDYDFRVTPACSRKVTRGCVRQFNFYDISQGIPKRIKLGFTPAPVGASGIVKGISATTESLLFASGKHKVAVSAQMSDGSESDLSKCATIVTIP
jgi:hypothetical protein